VAAAFPGADADRASAGADVTGVATMRLGRGEVGRVDAASDGRRGVLVKTLSRSDFGAKTGVFRDFARRAADLALRIGATSWDDAAGAAPEVERERQAVSRELREQVVVAEIAVLDI